MDKQEKVLVVDDEDSNRRLVEDILDDEGYEVLLTKNGEKALRILRQDYSIGVVLLDIMMPVMDGYTVLAEMKKDPNLRQIPVIMITAVDKTKSVVHCLGKGADDYLTKPFEEEVLKARVKGSLEKYRLLRAERDFFQKTLRESLKVITDILSVVNPLAFGRASRIRLLVKQIAVCMQVKKAWELDIAAMLSQLGCVTVPPEILEKVARGKPLVPEEKGIYDKHPEVGCSFIEHLPGLGGIAKMVQHQNRHYKSSDAPTTEAIPFGARVLHVAIDFDILISSGLEPREALDKIGQRKDYYDPQVVEALTVVTKKSFKTHFVSFQNLELGMILAQDIRTAGNVLLAAKDQEVSVFLRDQLRNFTCITKIPGMLEVFKPT